MDTPKIQAYSDLFAKKCKALWNELGEDLKWAKDVTEIKLQIEFLETKQDRLFKEYGRAVFQSGESSGPNVDYILQHITSLEQQLKEKYLELQKLKTS
ncbi:MAG: hypothetical protein H6Q74_1760 [Firmicutes bacterium]|nr:hypothetical protein [Bacillota bacterium]